MSEQIAVEERAPITTVTSENFEEYVDQQLGTANPDPEEQAEEAMQEIEEKKATEEKTSTANDEPKEGDTQGSKVFFKGKWVGKHDFQYRLHVQTEAKTKEADTKIAAAEALVKQEKEAREAAERTASELKNKYEPPKTDEVGPEPQPEQFQDLNEYKAAIKDWTAQKTRRDDRVALEQKKIQEQWGERLKAAKEKYADYEDVLSKSTVKVSDPVRDAILESDVGPEMLYHLAENPDLGDQLGKMTIARALTRIGKLEAEISGKQAKAPEKTAIAEISKAPEPISPLKGANAPAGNKISADGQFYGTYEEFKAARRAGKIK